MSCIPSLLFPILLRFIVCYILPETNFLFIIVKVSKLEDRTKLAMYFFAHFCSWLFTFISKINLRQCIWCVLYLGKLIHQQLQRLAILLVVSHQHFSVCCILGLLPM